jgi:hypothetical protein
MTANLDPAPFAVSLEQSKNRILRGLDRGQDVVWIPSVLGLLFYVFRMLPARLWAFIVARSR